MNPKSLSRQQRKLAFTLLELLGVIAIVAVIAALLFPMLSRMSERGKEVQRIANLKTIASAVHLYAADFDGSLPALCESASSGAWASPFWFQKIAPYLPEDRKQITLSTGTKLNHYKALICPFVKDSQHGGSDFGGNSGVFFAPGESPTGAPMRLAGIANPGEVILAASSEAKSSGMPSWYINARYYANYPDASSTKPSVKWTKRPYVAAVFVDGHYAEIAETDMRENRDKYLIPKNLLDSGWK